jgi:hypothetical protein
LPVPLQGEDGYRCVLIRPDKFLPSHANVFRNLPQQRWCNISAGMVWNGGAPAIRVAELHMRPALPHYGEPMLFKQ